MTLRAGEIEVLNVFTDGSAKSNSKTSNAGWAFYFPKLNIKKSGHLIGSNNVAELTAVKQALEYSIKQAKNNKPLVIFTDSEYVIKVLSNPKASIKENKELIENIKSIMISISKYTGRDIKFEKVKAHTKKDDWVSKCNDVVDKLAQAEASTKSVIKS